MYKYNFVKSLNFPKILPRQSWLCKIRSNSPLDNIHHICYGVYMNRYQIYLYPEDVNVLDELARLTDFSRSQIIRDVITRMAKQYEKLLARQTEKNNPLLQMAGFTKGPNRDITHNVNDIYLKD